MFTFKKEKRVTTQLTQYVSQVDDCVATARQALSSYFAGKFDRAHDFRAAVPIAARSSVSLRLEVRNGLYDGAFLPQMREDIHHLVESVDAIVNAVVACVDCVVTQRPEIHVELRPMFGELGQASFGSFDPLKRALLSYFQKHGSLSDVRQHATQVTECQRHAEDRQTDLMVRVFSSSLDLPRKLHLKHCLAGILAISQKVEKARNQLELISLKSVV